MPDLVWLLAVGYVAADGVAGGAGAWPPGFSAAAAAGVDG